ncbi:HAMP domain-containing histidine kinase [Candidatus Peregrinibacteria bacterium]|nr:HAMP domain-containing histidine kinase [Candidatus Peregrinibacteria bacterium]
MPIHITIIYAVSAIFMALIGLVVFVKDWKGWINRSFLIFSISIILWMWLLYYGYSNVPDRLDIALILFRYSFGASVFLPYSLALFFYFFPKKSFNFPSWVGVLFTGLTLALAFAAAFTPLVEEAAYMDGEIQKDVFGPLYTYYLYYCLFVFLFAVVCSIKNLIQMKGQDRTRLVYVSIGFFLFILGAMMTNVILPIFGIFILQAETVTFSLFFFIAAFYSIYKQRFFNLSFLVLQFLRELILLAVALLVLVVSYELLKYVTDDRYVVAILASLFAFAFYRLGNNYIPYFYSQRFSHLRKVLQEMNGKLFRCKTYEELNDLLESTFIEKLSFWNCHLYMITKKDIPDGIPLYLEDELTLYLKKHRTAVLDELRGDTSFGKKIVMVAQKLQTLQGHLCFGLFFENTLIGLFSVGSKLNRQMVSAEELQEMTQVMKDVGISFMNIIVNENLREENDVMKQIIDQKTQILRKNNTKLHEMIKQQDSFISLTAHEFRTPLTVAMLGMEQISKIHKGHISNEVVRDVQTSYRQLNRLTTLINRLLEMRRLEDNKVPVLKEKFELISFTKMLVNNMQLLASKDGVHMSFDGGDIKKLLVTTDQMKIQEVLENLMQNALKFSKKDDVIRVTVACDKKREHVSISVADQGPGVPKQDHKIIFEKFRQGSRYSRGIGVGLYLCKQYLNLLKGDISLKSVDGKGSTFTITFPTK